MPKYMWKGWFKDEDENKEELLFKSVKVKPDGDVSGVGSDDVGSFTITGSIEGHTVKFEKKYDDEGVDHIVEYRGFINSDLTRMKGDWNIGDVNGRFKLDAKEDLQAPKFKLMENGKVFWHHKEEWHHIGDDARQLQHHLKHVYIVSNEEKRKVYKWEYGTPGEWKKIGKECKKLFVTNKMVLMKSHKDGDFYLYDLNKEKWQKHPMKVYEPDSD